MKKILLFSLTIFLAAGCNFFGSNPSSSTTTSGLGGVACTQEAKLCPDGSYVARTGPTCEFASCPAAKQATSTPAAINSGIKGTITLAPTCAVQSIVPGHTCDPQPYSTEVIVKTADGTKEITRFTSSQDGSFKVNLAPGTYLLEPVKTNSKFRYPTAQQQQATVLANKFTTADIMFDSGLR